MTKKEWLVALINGATGKQGLNGSCTYHYSQRQFFAKWQGNHRDYNVNDIQENRN